MGVEQRGWSVDRDTMHRLNLWGDLMMLEPYCIPDDEHGRAYLVQTLIMNRNGDILTRMDGDGAKIEGGFGGGEDGVVTEMQQPRLNSVSGGARLWESPGDAARMEIIEELMMSVDGQRNLSGQVEMRTDLPYFVCFQQVDGSGYVLPAVIVLYHATEEEERLWSQDGTFRTLADLYQYSLRPEAVETMRPAFRAAIGIFWWEKQGSKEDAIHFIKFVNMIVLGVARNRQRACDLTLHFGALTPFIRRHTEHEDH